MSKRESIERYNLIIKRLRRHPSSFKEIYDYLAYESELQGYDYCITQRTFQRDINDIRSLFNIDIVYDWSRKAYCIDSYEQPELNERMLEAFDTFNALNLSQRLSEYIHFENRLGKGTENLYGLLNAIKNKYEVSFTYHKFQSETATNRKVKPLALKEFKNRWYLVAEDKTDENIKVFGLDRLAELTIEKTKYTQPSDFDVRQYFKHCFGIIRPENEEPLEVILSFDSTQGKYIKTLPLHESQNILEDGDRLVVKLTVYVTEDFVMEILSHGDKVKVIEPQSLVDEIAGIYRNSLNNY